MEIKVENVTINIDNENTECMEGITKICATLLATILEEFPTGVERLGVMREFGLLMLEWPKKSGMWKKEYEIKDIEENKNANL
jgi:hypothetical protein